MDLTHRLTPAFSIGTPPRISHEPIGSSGMEYGMLLNRFSLVEHTGTHIDVPRHFGAERADLAELTLEDLIVPLAVMDLAAEAAATRDFTVLPNHILDWEARHGTLPQGGCLALHTGFDPVEFMELIRSGKGRPESGMPGFSPMAVEWLIENRDLKGIAVDSLTLDSGAYTAEYPAHNAWLDARRWGLEVVANLDRVPPVGATLIVGAPPVASATGFPVRAIAMV